MKKIVVVGSGGAGKSTFSRKLGRALGVEVIHLDAIYWKPNWVKTPDKEWQKIVEKLIRGESWILDGNFGGTRLIRMEAGDTVIILDTPRIICIYRVLKRLVQQYGKSRPDMADGCTERFDLDFLRWVWNYPKDSRLRLLREIETLKGKSIVKLRSRKEVDRFLAGIGESDG